MEITSDHYIYHVDPASLTNSINFALKKFAYTYSEPVEESTIESVGITNIGDFLLKDLIVSGSDAVKAQADLLDRNSNTKDDKVVEFLKGKVDVSK